MAAESLKKIIQRQAYQLVIWQFAGIIGLTCAALLLNGKKSAASLFAGGLAYGLPNLIFVWRVFRYAGAGQMQRFMIAFFFGEMAKLVLSATLFILIVKYLAVSLLSVLVGFIGAIVSFWVVCMMHFARRKGAVR